MLAKILEDMWVEPEVLEALSEEQKRILFFKMREEQVRRWKEREDREDKEGGDTKDTRSKKGFTKHVTWLLGRDGDVRVSVIGGPDDPGRPWTTGLPWTPGTFQRVRAHHANGVQTVGPLAAAEAQRALSGEDVQLSPADGTGPEDPDLDSHGESGSGEDSQDDWAPPGRHGDRPALKGRHLLGTEEAGRQRRERSGLEGDASEHALLQDLFGDNLRATLTGTWTHL